VDGGPSAALLLTWLRALGQTATLYVPDRIDEGYGPNEAAMAQLAAQHDLIICVDCGTLSHDPIAAAVGSDVVVLDHHLGAESLPPAYAVVNPNRQDEDGALAHLCAAAVVFLVLVDAGRQMRVTGATGPDLMAMLDLVGLATIADVAPLLGVNRAFVRQGLKVMARRERPGLVALADVAGMDTAPTPYHLGYLLGPRINAGGRIGQADLGARLLATRDPHEAEALAERLNTLNTERRDIEAQVRAAALAQCEERGSDGPLAWAVGPGWHPGVVGIVASRLKEATHRPAIVIGVEDGIGKGSGRSVSGIDLGAPIQRLAAEGLLIKGGGHKMAAGLTVAEDKIEAAMARLGDLLARQGADALGPSDLRLDGMLMPDAATVGRRRNRSMPQARLAQGHLHRAMRFQPCGFTTPGVSGKTTSRSVLAPRAARAWMGSRSARSMAHWDQCSAITAAPPFTSRGVWRSTAFGVAEPFNCVWKMRHLPRLRAQLESSVLGIMGGLLDMTLCLAWLRLRPAFTIYTIVRASTAHRHHHGRPIIARPARTAIKARALESNKLM